MNQSRTSGTLQTNPMCPGALSSGGRNDWDNAIKQFQNTVELACWQLCDINDGLRNCIETNCKLVEQYGEILQELHPRRGEHYESTLKLVTRGR